MKKKILNICPQDTVAQPRMKRERLRSTDIVGELRAMIQQRRR
jgi:hypothetical protein